MPTPLPLRLGALTAVASLAIKRGWLPIPVSVLDKPHDERLRRKAMDIACKPGDRSIRTDDHKVEGRGGPTPARIYTRPDVQPGPAVLVEVALRGLRWTDRLAQPGAGDGVPI